MLEGVPDEVAHAVTDAVDCPTIGSGAGPAATGSARATTSSGLEDRTPAKFVRRYADLKQASVAAVGEVRR